MRFFLKSALLGALVFVMALVLAQALMNAAQAAQWLPGFEPPNEPKTPNRTSVDLSGTKTYQFEVCKPNGGTINIREVDTKPKSFAVTQTPGKTTTDVSACTTPVQPSVTGTINFRPGGACDTAEGLMHYFSISCGRCRFFLAVDNHDPDHDCGGEPGPEEPDKPDGEVELRYEDKNGKTMINPNTINQNNPEGRPCKQYGVLTWQDENASPPIVRFAYTDDPAPCE